MENRKSLQKSAKQFYNKVIYGHFLLEIRFTS